MDNRYRKLWIGLITSILIIIGYYVTYEMQELFSGAGKLLELVTRFAEAYIASFIFYWILEMQFYNQSKAKAKSTSSLLVFQISHHMRSLIDSLAVGYGITTSSNIDEIQNVEVAFENYENFQIKVRNIQFNPANIDDFLKMMRLLINSITDNINRPQDFRKFNDTGVMDLVDGIEKAALLDAIRIAECVDREDRVKGVLISAFPDYKLFYKHYLSLLKQMEKRGISTDVKDY